MKTLITTLLAATALTAVAGGAMAADLSVPGPAPVISAPAPTNWDGPYIGASVGYGWGTADISATSGTAARSASPSGFLIGAQLGYNFHLSDQIVAGIEGNIDWVNETSTFAGIPVTFDTNWEGSIRGRLGYDAGQFLPYVEAGVAFANATVASPGPSASNTQTGWTVGAGVEFMLADNLSANVEYRYSDYGSANYAGSPGIHLTDSTVRVGLNWHF